MLADAGLLVLVALVSPYADAPRARAPPPRRGGPRRSSRCTSTRRWRCARSAIPRACTARARAGTLHGLTGVDDPYEPPEDPDLVLDGTKPIADGVAALEALLEERGLR